MRDISRRKAMAKIAGVSTGLALTNLTGNMLVSGEDLRETGAQGPIASQTMTRSRSIWRNAMPLFPSDKL